MNTRGEYHGRDGYRYASPVGRPGGKLTMPEPTSAMPGTHAKLRVLEERASLGQQLYHPDDAVMDDREPTADMLSQPGVPGGSNGDEVYGRVHRLGRQ